MYGHERIIRKESPPTGQLERSNDKFTNSGILCFRGADRDFTLCLHAAGMADRAGGRALIAMIGLLRGRQISLVIKKVKKAG